MNIYPVQAVLIKKEGWKVWPCLITSTVTLEPVAQSFIPLMILQVSTRVNWVSNYYLNKVSIPFLSASASLMITGGRAADLHQLEIGLVGNTQKDQQVNYSFLKVIINEFILSRKQKSKQSKGLFLQHFKAYIITSWKSVQKFTVHSVAPILLLPMPSKKRRNVSLPTTLKLNLCFCFLTPCHIF